MVKLRPYVVAVNHVPECPRHVAGQGGRKSGRRRCAPGCERITDGWEVDLALRLPDGTPIRERVKAPVSGKSAALRWAQDLEAVILTQRGMRPKEEKQAPTLSEFKPRFIEGHVKANRLKPSSAEAYESVYRTHLLPAFGELRLDAIGDELVQRFKGELVEDELSSKSINNVLTALSVTLKRAVDWKVIAGEVAYYDFAEYHRLVEAGGEGGGRRPKPSRSWRGARTSRRRSGTCTCRRRTRMRPSGCSTSGPSTPRRRWRRYARGDRGLGTPRAAREPRAAATRGAWTLGFFVLNRADERRNRPDCGRFQVEAPGIEPGSERYSTRGSTRVSRSVYVTGNLRACNRSRSRPLISSLTRRLASRQGPVGAVVRSRYPTIAGERRGTLGRESHGLVRVSAWSAFYVAC